MMSRIAIVLGLVAAGCKSDTKPKPTGDGSAQIAETPPAPTEAGLPSGPLPVMLPAAGAEQARAIGGKVAGFVVVMRDGGLRVGKPEPGAAPYAGKAPRSSSTVGEDLDAALGITRPETASTPTAKTPVTATGPAQPAQPSPDTKSPDTKSPDTKSPAGDTSVDKPIDKQPPPEGFARPNDLPTTTIKQRGKSAGPPELESLEAARRRGILSKKRPPPDKVAEPAPDQPAAAPESVYTPVPGDVAVAPSAGGRRIAGIIVDNADRVDVIVLADAAARAATAIDVLGQLADRHAALAVAGTAAFGRLAFRFAGDTTGKAAWKIEIDASAAGVTIGGAVVPWPKAAGAITAAIGPRTDTPAVVAIHVADDANVQQLVDALAAAIAAGAIVDVGRRGS